MGVSTSKDFDYSVPIDNGSTIQNQSSKRKLKGRNGELCATSTLVEKIKPGQIMVPSYKKHPFTDYKFTKKIGSGAFSVVYKGTSVSNESIKVAIKEIRTGQLSKTQLIDLQMEMNILSQLKHPNIVQLYSVFVLPEKVFMITEYVRGGELLQAICRRKQYEEMDAQRIMTQIVLAIKYIHTKNVVHRDLKPENIILLSRSANSSVKIVDFGFAIVLDNHPSRPCKYLRGTPGYMAPEILERGFYSTAGDIWSLGVVLFVLLSGTMPFNPKQEDRILAGAFTFSTSHWEPVSKEARDLVVRMLTVNPKERITANGILQHPWLASAVAAAEHASKTAAAEKAAESAKEAAALVSAEIAADEELRRSDLEMSLRNFQFEKDKEREEEKRMLEAIQVDDNDISAHGSVTSGDVMRRTDEESLATSSSTNEDFSMASNAAEIRGIVSNITNGMTATTRMLHSNEAVASSQSSSQRGSRNSSNVSALTLGSGTDAASESVSGRSSRSSSGRSSRSNSGRTVGGAAAAAQPRGSWGSGVGMVLGLGLGGFTSDLQAVVETDTEPAASFEADGQAACSPPTVSFLSLLMSSSSKDGDSTGTASASSSRRSSRSNSGRQQGQGALLRIGDLQAVSEYEEGEPNSSLHTQHAAATVSPRGSITSSLSRVFLGTGTGKEGSPGGSSPTSPGGGGGFFSKRRESSQPQGEVEEGGGAGDSTEKGVSLSGGFFGLRRKSRRSGSDATLTESAQLATQAVVSGTTGTGTGGGGGGGGLLPSGFFGRRRGSRKSDEDIYDGMAAAAAAAAASANGPGIDEDERAAAGTGIGGLTGALFGRRRGSRRYDSTDEMEVAGEKIDKGDRSMDSQETGDDILDEVVWSTSPGVRQRRRSSIDSIGYAASNYSDGQSERSSPSLQPPVSRPLSPATPTAGSLGVFGLLGFRRSEPELSPSSALHSSSPTQFADTQYETQLTYASPITSLRKLIRRGSHHNAVAPEPYQAGASGASSGASSGADRRRASNASVVSLDEWDEESTPLEGSLRIVSKPSFGSLAAALDSGSPPCEENTDHHEKELSQTGQPVIFGDSNGYFHSTPIDSAAAAAAAAPADSSVAEAREESRKHVSATKLPPLEMTAAAPRSRSRRGSLRGGPISISLAAMEASAAQAVGSESTQQQPGTDQQCLLIANRSAGNAHTSPSRGSPRSGLSTLFAPITDSDDRSLDMADATLHSANVEIADATLHSANVGMADATLPSGNVGMTETTPLSGNMDHEAIELAAGHAIVQLHSLSHDQLHSLSHEVSQSNEQTQCFAASMDSATATVGTGSGPLLTNPIDVVTGPPIIASSLTGPPLTAAASVLGPPITATSSSSNGDLSFALLSIREMLATRRPPTAAATGQAALGGARKAGSPSAAREFMRRRSSPSTIGMNRAAALARSSTAASNTNTSDQSTLETTESALAGSPLAGDGMLLNRLHPRYKRRSLSHAEGLDRLGTSTATTSRGRARSFSTTHSHTYIQTYSQARRGSTDAARARTVSEETDDSECDDGSDVYMSEGEGGFGGLVLSGQGPRGAFGSYNSVSEDWEAEKVGLVVETDRQRSEGRQRGEGRASTVGRRSQAFYIPAPLRELGNEGADGEEEEEQEEEEEEEEE